MLSFVSPQVELVDMRDGRLVFRSNKSFATGKKHSVRLVLPPGSGQMTVLEVMVESVRQLPGGGSIYSSRVLGKEPGCVASVPVADTSMRNAPRHTVGVRCMSKRIPGYRAMTIDMSRTGLQLELDGAVSKGDVFPLTLEFDRHDLPPVAVDAQVMWCRPFGEDRFRAGLKFKPSSPELAKQIRMIADFFEQRSQADLQALLEQAKLLTKDSGPVPQPAKTASKGRKKSFDIPLEAIIAGYRWDLDGRRLVLSLKAPDGEIHGLEFPQCQSLRDCGCGSGAVAAKLRSSTETCDMLKLVEKRVGPGSWKHYQLLDAQSAVLLELVSEACRFPG